MGKLVRTQPTFLNKNIPPKVKQLIEELWDPIAQRRPNFMEVKTTPVPSPNPPHPNPNPTLPNPSPNLGPTLALTPTH